MQCGNLIPWAKSAFIGPLLEWWNNGIMEWWVSSENNLAGRFGILASAYGFRLKDCRNDERLNAPSFRQSKLSFIPPAQLSFIPSATILRHSASPNSPSFRQFKFSVIPAVFKPESRSLECAIAFMKCKTFHCSNIPIFSGHPGAGPCL
ncbi:MAG: hypothetical protein C4576_12545 [Desulfobacteraceae bacterium]|nr:MAG: hypothetical protein C4576_12545 [Desulfobacteraceae bacterium]